MKNIFRNLLSILLLMGLSSSLALAQSRTTLIQEPVYQDDISMQLTAENWLSSKSARIYVQILASFDEKQSSDIQQKVMQNLKKISSAADWKFTSFNRTKGNTGLEQWVINVEGRLGSDELDGVRGKFSSQNIPGYRMRLQNINYSPTEAEKSANFILLRKNIYAQAAAELDMLNSLFPARKYRISRIDFSPSALQYQRPSSMREVETKMFQVSRDEGSSDMQVSNKIRLHASVVISASHLPARQK